MDLRIHTQQAQIGIQQPAGQLSINGNHATMRMDIRDPQLFIQQEEAVLFIDQRQCFSEAGLKSIREMTQKYAAKGKQAALRAAAEIANEGRQMANIQNGVVIGRIAKQKSKPKERQFSFDMIPKSRPEIDVRRGETRFSYQKGQVSVDAPSRSVDIRYNPGDVKIYLKQKDYIRIDYVGKQVDIYGG